VKCWRITSLDSEQHYPTIPSDYVAKIMQLMTEMFTKLPVGCCKLHPIHIILVQSSYTDTNLTIPQKVEGRVNWSTAVVVLQPVPNAICNDNGNLYNTSLTWTFINKSDMHNVAWWNGSSLFGWVELGLELGLSSNNIPACTLKVNLLVIWDLMARSAQNRLYHAP